MFWFFTDRKFRGEILSLGVVLCGCSAICCIDFDTSPIYRDQWSPMITPWYSGNIHVTDSRPSLRVRIAT